MSSQDSALSEPWRKNVTWGLLLLVSVFSYLDRQIFTLFQDDIKAELGLGDAQLGLLTGLSFALFYTLAAFPIARYADRGDRRAIIAVCVSVWSLATAFCGLAHSFWQMVLVRVGLAAGEAGAGPAGISLLTEIFPISRRTTIITSTLAASSVGLSLGMALGGWLSQFYGWRTVFIIIGLPGVLLGVLVFLFASEPRRSGRGQDDVAEQLSLSDVFRTMTGSVSLRWIALLLSTVPLTGTAFILWGASFLQRIHDMSKAETGLWLGGALAAGLVLGNLAAGWVSDRYGKADPRWNGWFAGITLFATFPLALAFIYTPNKYIAIGAFVLVKFSITLFLGPTMNMSFTQVPVAMRAMMSATMSMIIGLAGVGLGGTLTGVLSQAFSPAYGDLSLQPALALISCLLLIGGTAAIQAGRTARPLETETSRAEG